MDAFLYYLTQYGLYLLYAVMVFVIIKLITKASLKNYHSKWNTLIDNFNYASSDFYKLLIEELKSHGVDGITTKHVFLKEGNALSSKRTYLRVSWKDYEYDICAAPFGNGFFVSWWLLYKDSFWQRFITRIPFIGSWLARKLFPVTYYKIDTASMFMSYAQSSVLKTLETITENKGTRALTEMERKPIMQDIFKR